LAQSNPLTRELKAAFADALTWAPEYPGIGRIPRILSGVAGAGREIDARDFDAMVGNALADEHGKRSFVLDADDLPDARAGAAPVHDAAAAASQRSPALSMRGHLKDEATARACADLCVAVVTSTLGLRARSSVRALHADEGGGFAFDLVAARERPRGAHAPHTVHLIALDDGEVLAAKNPFARLARGGVVALRSEKESADAVWSEAPAYLKAIVFDRGARLVGFGSAGGGAGFAARWRVAATFAGLALALASHEKSSALRGAVVDGSLVAREVKDAIRTALETEVSGEEVVEEAVLRAGADAARSAFEAHVEVPRALVERDEESVRLGRKDARASSPPR
jgi:pyruvate-ferredoxin/flavodoxin oxidoreductase